jgi:hypothetical protein
VPAFRALRSLDRRIVPVLGGFLRVGRHRRRRPVFGGVVLACSLALVAAAAWLVSGAPDRPHQAKVQVGVADGQSVPAYVQRARRNLADLATSAPPATPVYALVSFTGYLPPSRLAGLLTGVEPQRVYARVPRAGAAGSVAELPVHDVPGDVDSGMAQLATDRQRIATDFGRLARAADGAARTQYQREQHTYQVEATGYQQRCACVFAAVVRGTPGALRAVADRSAVRAVDPAQQVKSLSGAVFTPPLPEQTGAAVPPGVDATPTPTGKAKVPTGAPDPGPAQPPASTAPSPTAPASRPPASPSPSPVAPSATPDGTSSRTGGGDPTPVP